jgi:hypothetical protein
MGFLDNLKRDALGIAQGLHPRSLLHALKNPDDMITGTVDFYRDLVLDPVDTFTEMPLSSVFSLTPAAAGVPAVRLVRAKMEGSLPAESSFLDVFEAPQTSWERAYPLFGESGFGEFMDITRGDLFTPSSPLSPGLIRPSDRKDAFIRTPDETLENLTGAFLDEGPGRIPFERHDLDPSSFDAFGPSIRGRDMAGTMSLDAREFLNERQPGWIDDAADDVAATHDEFLDLAEVPGTQTAWAYDDLVRNGFDPDHLRTLTDQEIRAIWELAVDEKRITGYTGREPFDPDVFEPMTNGELLDDFFGPQSPRMPDWMRYDSPDDFFGVDRNQPPAGVPSPMASWMGPMPEIDPFGRDGAFYGGSLAPQQSSMGSWADSIFGLPENEMRNVLRRMMQRSYEMPSNPFSLN